jgi:hypothetical protein
MITDHAERHCKVANEEEPVAKRSPIALRNGDVVVLMGDVGFW